MLQFNFYLRMSMILLRLSRLILMMSGFLMGSNWLLSRFNVALFSFSLAQALKQKHKSFKRLTSKILWFLFFFIIYPYQNQVVGMYFPLNRP